MKKTWRYFNVLFLGAAAACGQEIRSAGELFVYLDATNVTGVAEGAYVASWANRGTLDEFVPAVPGKGATYAANVAGAIALQFDGTPACAMAQAGYTNNATKGGVPLSLLGTNVWSSEVWVYNPGATNIETLLTWTSRRDGGNYRMMEMRYGSDAGNAVEHYMRNIGWTLGLPAFGQWHHVACTRDAACVNRLYLDGRLVTTLDMGGANMLNLATNNALFGVGAVETWSGWDYPLSGAIAVVRVHDGTLSAADVLNNFQVECGRFGLEWQNAGTASWNTPANWQSGAIPPAGSPVYINNGGTPVYDGAPYADGVSTSLLHAVNGGLTVAGGVYTAQPWILDSTVRLGFNAGAAFSLGVAGGVFNAGANTLRLGDAAGATGTVSFATGGRLITQRIQKGSGTAQITADGGTLQAVGSATDFLQGLDSAKVKAGGLTFDVPTNVSITVAQALQEDAASRGGGLSKVGPGTLTLSGANTVTGALAVSGGSMLIQSGALSSGFAAPVTLSDGGNIGWNQTGGATILANHLTAGSSGSLTLYVANTNDSINLSSVSNVTLRTDGTFTYTGTLTPYTNRFLFAPNNGTVTFSQPIADQPGAVGRVESRGTASGWLKLTGDSSYTGGTLLESGGLIMTHANALGMGTEGVQDIVCGSGTVLRVQTPLNSPSFFSRVAAAPYMSLQLSGAGLTNTLDFSSSPNIFTGSENTSVKSYFVGTLTPYGNTYLLGNSGVDVGDQAYGFVITNLTDGAGGVPRRVLIKGVGVVDTRNSANHSGGTRIEDGGKIVVTGDRGFGAVPAVFDPSNIVFNNGGVFRTETPFVTLAKTRGIVFGPGTTRIHASGALPAQLMIPGDITGTSTLRMTDWGWVTFAGSNNTYSGRVQLEGNVGALMIGNGTNFSWTSTGGIVGTGSRSWLYLNNGGSDTFADAFSGNGLLTKKGLGTVTLAAAQTHKYLPTNTVIEAGTLRYGVQDALASGAGWGVVDLWANAFLDVNGFAATLNGLTGGGCVTNTAATAVGLNVGSDSLASAFSGSFASPITLTKVGTNVLTLTHFNPTREPVTVAAGTLALGPGTALTNGVAVSNSARVQATSYQGLRSEYYDNAFQGTTGGTWPGLGTTPEAVEAVLAGRAPSLITGSGSFGTYFDSTTNGAAFPGKYSGSVDKFAVRWTGRFNAETPGSYYFNILADDACMLFLDGALVVNNRTGGGWASGSVTLTQGQHDIMMFFYENGGLQIIRIWMTPPGGTYAQLPQRLLSTYPVTVAGLAGVAGSRVGVDDYGQLNLIEAADTTFGGFVGAGLGNAVIEKQGTGVLTLTDTSSFCGLTRLVEGGLTLADGVSHTGALDVVNGTLTLSGGTSVDTAPVLIGPLSATAEGALALAAKTVLRINQTTNGTFAGTLAGGTADSVIAKDGAAELVIAGDASAYPGAWEAMAGNLVIGPGGLLASDARIATRAGGALVFRSPTNLVFAGAISGTGAVRNEGPGALTLTGEISCGVQVAAGQTVIVSGASSSTLALGACINEGTLVFERQGTVLLSKPITGSGRVSVGPDTTLAVGQGGYTDSQEMLLNGGTLLLNNGSSLFFDDTMWVTTGVSRFVTNALGQTLLELNPNLPNTRGAAYYRERVSTAAPCVIDVTFHKGVSTNSPGDGFGIFFQNDARGTRALPSAWYEDVRTFAPSFGFQYYLMPGNCYLAWVTNGVIAGRVDNSLFTQNNGPFSARMIFDGTKMVIDMQQGATRYSMTNLTAGAMMSALIGPEAWLGVVGGTGGSYGQQFIDALTYTSFEETERTYTNDVVLAAGAASTLQAASSENGSQPLVVGDVEFEAGSSLSVVPAAGTGANVTFVSLGNVTVSGNAALAITSQSQAILRGDTWTFMAGAVLTVTGKVTLPTTVYVAVDGTIPDGRMNLADFRSAEIENLADVTFVLVGGDATDRVNFRDGWLYTTGTQGTMIQLR
ncbi:MAG TPA: PA14 domain-containing protein [Kiritimatiellia bacterium]|nr:PA14 domain-containing protein [Kiritimatiellia bacterium]